VTAKTRFPQVNLEDLKKILPEQVLVNGNENRRGNQVDGSDNHRGNQKDKKKNKQRVGKTSNPKSRA